MFSIYTRYCQVVVSFQAVPNSITTLLNEITQYDGTIYSIRTSTLECIFLYEYTMDKQNL